ncbi:MAG: AmmeMemoRadiSam system protein A, partial [Deltaproteobacteria bacterium]|nr:AmmeMemoRadiSam system protein A [Deltaproteobacteria bacterium]
GQRVRRVVVMGPSHRVPFAGLAVTDATHWRTPLGEVPIDTDAVRKLRESRDFAVRDDAFRQEHSVDIQVPFVQVVAPEASIVPIVIGHVDAATAARAGKALRAVIDEATVVVASSDFTHYGDRFGYEPFPPKDAPAALTEYAARAWDAIRVLDAAAFRAHLDRTGDTICGAAPIQVLLAALPRKAQGVRLAFDTSGRQEGDYANSVSYLSGAFKLPPDSREFRNHVVLPEADQRFLVELARDTIRRHLAGRDLPDPVKEGRAVSDLVRKEFGVFVTLKKHGDLRGCIGSIFPVEPLYQGVIRNAVNAASHDPRFRPLTQAEEPEVEIEVSVLTPPEKVDGPEDIVVGRDGVVLGKGGSRAVFLPQVAPEQGWDLATMLTHLSMKAGLSGGAWKSGAEFQVFQAHVFGEEDFKGAHR